MNTKNSHVRPIVLAVLIALAASPAFAQHEGHVMPQPEEEAAEDPHAGHEMPEQEAAPADDPHAGHVMPAPEPDAAEDPHAGHVMPAQDAEPAEDPHAGHVMPTPEPDVPEDPHAGHVMPTAEEEVTSDPHAAHAVPVQDTQPTEDPHAGHVMPAPDPATMQDPHAGHAMPSAMVTDAQDLPATAAPLEPIPPISAADRAAAFPAGVDGHTVHDNAVHYYVLLDRLEMSDAPGSDAEWEAISWIGTDLDRLWFRSEGELVDGEAESANFEAFYGRAIATWWDGLIGLRHDFGEGPSRTYAAIGVMGQAPYKFEVDATAYLGEDGQAGLGLEAEYDTLLTNRLILQWLVEAEAWTQDDHGVGIGSGLSTIEAGLRLRYEFSRRFAPYIGIARERAFGETAELRRLEGDHIDDTRLVAGVRFWF